MNAETNITGMAWREVVALHAFFEGWFRSGGEAPDFTEPERALGLDFSMIGPDGEMHGRDAILERLRGARGAYPADFRIEVRDPAVIWARGEAVLLEYTEQQYRDGARDARRSTALFLASAAAPRGVEWRHLQETWIEAPQSSQQGPAGAGEGS
jgi:hypothetical protein